MDPATRDLLAAIRKALEAGVERHVVLSAIDYALEDGLAKPTHAARALRELAEREDATP